MTRRDYLFLAETIRNSEAKTFSARHLTRDIADALARANQRFDRDLFLRNCGVVTDANT